MLPSRYNLLVHFFMLNLDRMNTACIISIETWLSVSFLLQNFKSNICNYSSSSPTSETAILKYDGKFNAPPHRKHIFCCCKHSWRTPFAQISFLLRHTHYLMAAHRFPLPSTPDQCLLKHHRC